MSDQPPAKEYTNIVFSYEVEAIHDHEFRKKGKQYVLLYNVKWKNYPTSENTLEPEENLV